MERSRNSNSPFDRIECVCLCTYFSLLFEIESSRLSSIQLRWKIQFYIKSERKSCLTDDGGGIIINTQCWASYFYSSQICSGEVQGDEWISDLIKMARRENAKKTTNDLLLTLLLLAFSHISFPNLLQISLSERGKIKIDEHNPKPS